MTEPTERVLIECGQCEGAGTTDAMGYSEECPVCDGTGDIPELQEQFDAGCHR